MLYDGAALFANISKFRFSIFFCSKDKGDAAVIKAEDNLRSALAVDQAWMLSALARQEGGIKFLIDIRADILVFKLFKFNYVKNRVNYSSH